ncbi:GSCOCG00004365001-RA-CDS [Cotesia congregata]|uniref:Peroxisomal ATPase PEX1 n=1 Tax=Cotesia congregata TaxID=51543 RepID=A0A8J2E352_COTCN|nr:GSCOCG00004365001-RA-CDS [Cotesia congregata]CAG5075603.1 Similar to Pex1: Peroxisome biogenesis factor 1 (Mus musculus) [Cotesia congregata]
MAVEQLKSKYFPVKNCFIYLPNSWSKKLTKVNAIEITIDNGEKKSYYFSHAHSQTNFNDQFLCINASFAQSLNIGENNNLLVNLISDSVPVLTSIIVLPKNKDDYEIVSLRAGKIQELILQQISIVAINQSFVIWLSKNLHVTLIVDKITPHYHYGKLQQFTEVHVSNYETKPTSRSSNRNYSQTNNLSTEVGANEVETFLSNYEVKKLPPLFRACIVESAETFSDQIHSNLVVFISLSQSIKWFSIGQEKYFFCLLKKVPSISDKENTHPSDVTNKIVKMVISDYVQTNFEAIDNDSVFLTEYVAEQFKLQLGSKIVLTKCDIEQSKPCDIDLVPINKNDITIEAFENYIKQYEEILINNQSKILACGITFLVKLMVPYILLGKNTVKDFNIVIKDVVEEPEKKKTKVERKKLINFRTMETIMEECRTICWILLKSYSTKRFQYNRQNILIAGGTGTGKTSICETMLEQLSQSPYYFYTKTIDCKKLKSKKVEAISKVLKQAINDCSYHQPSILFLDNLDCITNNKVSGNEENSADSINATRIADTLMKIVSIYQATNCITLMATCLNIERLGTKLKTKRGLNLFTRLFKLDCPTKNERCEIMEAGANAKEFSLSSDIRWDYFADKTESFVMQDFVDFIEKACYNAWKRNVNSEINSPGKIILTNDDLMSTFERFNSIASHALPLFSGSGHGWSDIGGLKDIKDCLVELLQWPLIYTELYKNAPIRLQSGVLLYGMPGTGKTMIAGAIAKECGLNFINIKGPELLSKYIGASEEAVREIFQKAQRAKPCVLFFDEFDSLAPRRGHDSTGVTDRVVNQLLTEFDGVEGREGVAIVAASSRPDLLDPALLRPGRLDKALLCPLPQESDREEILKVLCKQHNLTAEDFDLKALAKMTENFTGADLNAVFVQARMNAIDESYAEMTIDKSQKSLIKKQRVITHDCLLKSLESTQPSLTEKEIMKFNSIYRKFSNGDNFSEEIVKNQKLTLA